MKELFRIVSEKTGVSKENVEKIVNFQFSDARAATMEYAVVDICKLFKFTINQAKIKKMEQQFIYKIGLIKAEMEQSDEGRRGRLQIDLTLFENNLQYILTKVREELPPTKHKENNDKRKKLRQQQLVLETVDNQVDQAF